MKDYVIAIPSKGRANRMRSKSLFLPNKKIHIFVNSSEEAKEYAQLNPECKIVNARVNNVGDAHNAIFDYFPKNTNILIACDDVRDVRTKDGKTWHSAGVKGVLSPKQIDGLIRCGFSLSQKFKAKLWGISPTISGGIMLQDKISFFTFIVGSFWGIINSDLRFDTVLKRKHDYDFTIKHILRYGRILRFDGVRCSPDFSNKKGGGNEGTSNDKYGALAVERLFKKYPEYFVPHKTRENEVSFRPHALLRRRKVKQSDRILKLKFTTREWAQTNFSTEKFYESLKTQTL